MATIDTLEGMRIKTSGAKSATRLTKTVSPPEAGGSDLRLVEPTTGFDEDDKAASAVVGAGPSAGG